MIKSQASYETITSLVGIVKSMLLRLTNLKVIAQ